MRHHLIKLFILLFTLSFSAVAAELDEIQIPHQKKGVDYLFHTVLPGQSLSAVIKLCCKANVHYRELARYNDIENVNLVMPGHVLKIPVAFLKSTPAPIKIMVLSGDVSIKHANQSAYVTLKASDPVVEGDVIKTGAKSIAKLRFANDSVLNLQPNSMVGVELSQQITQTKTIQIKLNLNEGRAEVHANPDHHSGDQFEVETPSAVAVVRGTKFRVAADGDVGIQETLEGSVSFATAKKSVIVNRGFGTLAEKGKAPLPPQALPETPSVSGFTSKFEFLPIEFNLNDQSDARLMLAQVAKDNAFEDLVLEKSVAVSGSENRLAFNRLTDGQYFLKLRAQDAQGLQGEDVIHPFTVDVLPLPPTQLLEQKTFIGQQLSWGAMTGGNGYVVQVASDAAFEDVLLEKTLTYHSYYLTELLPESGAYWRVAHKDDVQTIKFSKSRKLNP
jgi:hypothetical protein